MMPEVSVPPSWLVFATSGMAALSLIVGALSLLLGFANYRRAGHRLDVRLRVFYWQSDSRSSWLDSSGEGANQISCKVECTNSGLSKAYISCIDFRLRFRRHFIYSTDWMDFSRNLGDDGIWLRGPGLPHVIDGGFSESWTIVLPEDRLHVRRKKGWKTWRHLLCVVRLGDGRTIKVRRHRTILDRIRPIPYRILQAFWILMLIAALAFGLLPR
jgi:hypothetical protein